MKNLAIFLFFVVLLSGCESIMGPSPETMDTWKGAHYSEVIKAWGAPRQILDDGKGGQILVYYQSSETSDSDITPMSGGGYSATERTTTLWRQTLFFTDTNGVITDWRIIRN